MQQMGGGMAGGTYQPIPGAAATMEMPTIPIAGSSPASGKGGKKGAAQAGGGSNAALSPGLAAGMYNLGGGRGAQNMGAAAGGRGAARASSTTPRGGKGSGKKSKE